jgi:potassium efflux system protein
MHHLVRLFSILVVLAVVFIRTAPAQSNASLSETNLNLQAWQLSLTNLFNRTNLEVSIRQRAAELHTNALVRARGLVDLETRIGEYQKSISCASNLLFELRQTRVAEITPTNELASMDSRQLETKLTQAEADLALARKTLTGLESDANLRESRRTEAPKALAETKTRLDEIEIALKAPVDPNESPEISRANLLYLLTRKAFRERERESLDLELKTYAATADLLSLQTVQAASRVAALARQVDSLRIRLDEKRKLEARAAAEAARLQEAETRNPVLQSLAATNSAYAGDLVTLNGLIQRANEVLAAKEKDLAALDQDYKNLAARVTANEAAGVTITDSIGVLLRRHRVDLARRAGSADTIRSRIARITDSQLQEIDFKDRKAEFIDLDTVVAETLARIGAASGSNRTKEVHDLIENRVKLLNDLITAHRSLADSLSRVNVVEISLRKSTADFRRFVEERVLWIRSASPLAFTREGTRPLADEALTYAVLLNWNTWAAISQALISGLVASPATTALWALALLMAFGAQPRVRKRLDAESKLARAPTQVSLLPTLKSFGLTLAMSMPGPALLYGVSWLLEQGFDQPPVATQLARALAVSALFYLTLGFYRHFMRSNGLAICHLAWPAESAAKIRRHLTWLIATAVPTGGFIVFAESRVGEGGEDRLTFISLMLVLACFLHILFNPNTGLAFNPTSSRTGATTRRLRYLAAVIMPVGLAITSALGYHLTAIEFSWRLTNSIWLVLGITLASGIIVRWFYLERRRIALEKLRIKREAAAADSPEKAKALESELPDVSVTEVKEQTQSLLRTLVLVSVIGGLWGLWSGVLPALNILDRKALWYVEETVSARAEKTALPEFPGMPGPTSNVDQSDDKADTSSRPKTIERPITPANLLFAVFVLVVTGIAARNLPGFLEISILKHLKLETGGGYAITTIIQYVVTIAGLVIACASIGLTWEKVQWLAAAVTLGIGFGLQEIFANFVAGIILLFERPVRVGDVITVDGTSGTVTRIRIRATTIRNWDQQELIIPNKDLITGRLTNWTLSDTTNRVVVTVGVAYGTDTRKVSEILRQIVDDHPHILPEPASRITFDQFGDSCLNFTVRAYLSSLDDRLDTIHTLHEMINDRFNAAGIEISFPQRDLHIRTLPPGLGGALKAN